MAERDADAVAHIGRRMWESFDLDPVHAAVGEYELPDGLLELDRKVVKGRHGLLYTALCDGLPRLQINVFVPVSSRLRRANENSSIDPQSGVVRLPKSERLLVGLLGDIMYLVDSGGVRQ